MTAEGFDSSIDVTLTATTCTQSSIAGCDRIVTTERHLVPYHPEPSCG
jgi:hypothetical protein